MVFPFRKAGLASCRPASVKRCGLPILMTIVLMVFLLVTAPLGADNSPSSNSVAALVAELIPRTSESGFAELAISKARDLSKLVDSLALISELITPGTQAVDRKALYVERASIQELLGLYEEAANSWEAALAAQPGQGEAAWLLSAAACKLAIGDTEGAVAMSKAALLTTANPRLVAMAILIEARTLMLAGDLASSLARAKDALALGASGFEGAALSLARDVSSGAEREGYVNRLKEEYAGWPETHDALTSIFYSLANFDSALSLQVPLPPSATSAVADSISSEGKQPEGKREVISGPLYYQLGAFRDEANAVLLSTKLVRAGFSPKTVRRESRAGILSIVYLEAGSDPASLMIALKDAGFESWPLFAEP